MTHAADFNGHNGYHNGDQNGHQHGLPDERDTLERGETPQNGASLGGWDLGFQARLMRLFIHEVQQSGHCPYPELVDLVESVYALEPTLSDVILPTGLIADLTRQLQESQITALVTCVEMQQALGELLQHLTWHSQPEDAVVYAFTGHLNRLLPILSQAISRITDIAERFTATVGADRPDSSIPSRERVLRDKYIADLSYIRTYLVEQVSADVWRLQQGTQRLRLVYFSRLLQYLDALPNYCVELSQLTQQALQGMGPGNLFSK